MNKLLIFFVAVLFSINHTPAQETRKQIKDYINTEIIIDNNWTGESITLVTEKDNYFIIRKIFGSGVDVAKILKYSVTFKSDYQIDFSEIIEPTDDNIIDTEKFSMMVEENEISISLNGLSVVTHIKTTPTTNKQ